MAEASLALQRSLRTAFAAHGTLSALVGGRIFDTSSKPTEFPTVVIGEDQVVNDAAHGYEGSEVFATVHVWSRDSGMTQTKNIVGAMREALPGAIETVDGHRIAHVHFEGARYLRDPDGQTRHGVVTIRALVGKAVP